MTINIIDGFDVSAPKPLDIREVVTTLVDRDNIDNNKRYIGLVTWVNNEEKEYRLIGGISNNDWVEVISTESPIKEDIITLTQTHLDNKFITISFNIEDTDNVDIYVENAPNTTFNEIIKRDVIIKNKLTWLGTILENILIIGDKITVRKY